MDATLLGAIEAAFDLAWDPTSEILDFKSSILDLDDMASKFANLSFDKKVPPLLTLWASICFIT